MRFDLSHSPSDVERVQTGRCIYLQVLGVDGRCTWQKKHQDSSMLLNSFLYESCWTLIALTQRFEMAKLYTVKPAPGKGQGVFAKKALPAGTVIVRDRPVMKLKMKRSQFTEEEVLQAFMALSPDDRARFMELHEGPRKLKTKVMRIYKANCFQIDGYCKLLLDVSRVNHSCMPNARTQSVDGNDCDDEEVVLIETVQANEEVSIDYHPATTYTMTASQRGAGFFAYFGFHCSCQVCSLPLKMLVLSDARRQLIKVLSEIVDGLAHSDYRGFQWLTPETAEKLALYLGKSMTPVDRHLTDQQNCAYNIMLTRLLEAEGLMYDRVGSCYWRAALALWEQMQENVDIAIIPSADNMEAWIGKSIEASSKFFGKEGEQTRRLRGQWENLKTDSLLSAARQCVSFKIGRGPCASTDHVIAARARIVCYTLRRHAPYWAGYDRVVVERRVSKTDSWKGCGKCDEEVRRGVRAEEQAQMKMMSG